MKFLNIQRVLLFTVVCLALILRIYSLSTVPPHPSLDEVSIGYNAYSILKTGADEYGNKLPVLLRAYDDYRPALYVYLVIPFIKIFGLNVLSVRLPSVILSVISVFVTFFLTRELLKKVKNRKYILFWIPLSSAFFLAISPWHIYVSRLGHEVNASLSFLILGIYFFLYFVNSVSEKKTNFFGRYSILISSIFFALSFSSYQSTKVVVPAIVIMLTVLYLKYLLIEKRLIILAAILGLIISLPILVSSLNPEALIRYKGTNVFTSNPKLLEQSSKKLLEEKNRGNLVGQVLNNRRVVYLDIFSQAYFSHFTIDFLFGNSGDDPFKAPNSGLLYFFEIPLLIMGLFFLRQYVKRSIFLILWILVAIIPAAITTGYPHAMRAFSIIPTPQIIGAVGLFVLVETVFKIRVLLLKVVLCGIFIFIVIFSCLQFTYNYFYLLPKNISDQFQYGVTNAMEYARKSENKYQKIIVSNNGDLAQSYMYYLFVNKFDPSTYQKNGGTVSAGFDKEHRIGKYFFMNPVKDKADKTKTLFIVNKAEEGRIPAKKISEVLFLNNTPAIGILEAN